MTTTLLQLLRVCFLTTAIGGVLRQHLHTCSAPATDPYPAIRWEDRAIEGLGRSVTFTWSEKLSGSEVEARG